jgi:hypothetical protein
MNGFKQYNPRQCLAFGFSGSSVLHVRFVFSQAALKVRIHLTHVISLRLRGGSLHSNAAQSSISAWAQRSRFIENFF